MISNYKRVIVLLICLLSMTPLASWSQSELLANGQIDEVGSNYIVITDSKYKTLSVVKVFLANKKPGQMTDLKKGDFVKLKLLKIDKVDYIEAIQVVLEP